MIPVFFSGCLIKSGMWEEGGRVVDGERGRGVGKRRGYGVCVFVCVSASVCGCVAGR